MLTLSLSVGIITSKDPNWDKFSKSIALLIILAIDSAYIVPIVI